MVKKWIAVEFRGFDVAEIRGVTWTPTESIPSVPPLRGCGLGGSTPAGRDGVLAGGESITARAACHKQLVWTDALRRRLAEKAKAIGPSALAILGTIVTPDTLLRWYRNLVAAKYDSSRKRGLGRPRRKPDIATLVIRMAEENPSWGNARIRGALFNLGHDIARNSIKAILKERGMDPAPERGRRTSWHTFIKSHRGAIAGADSFTVEFLRGSGLVRYWVMFVIDVGTRRVHIADITDQPSEAWMNQVASNVTDGLDPSA